MREQHPSVASPNPPNQGPGLRPRHVPWQEIKLANFCFVGGRPTHWVTAVQAPINLIFNWICWGYRSIKLLGFKCTFLQHIMCTGHGALTIQSLVSFCHRLSCLPINFFLKLSWPESFLWLSTKEHQLEQKSVPESVSQAKGPWRIMGYLELTIRSR